MLQVVETEGRDGLVGEQRTGLDDLAVHQEAADQPVVVAQAVPGHTVGGQQKAGHLEATLGEDHLLGSNGEAAPVQAGHLHAGDGAGILIGVQLDRVGLHDEPHVLALLDPAADAFGERGLRAGHVQLGLQGVVLEVQQLALVGDPRSHLQ